MTPEPPRPADPVSAPVMPRDEVAPGLVFSDTPSRFAAYLVDGVLVAIIAALLAEPIGWADIPATPAGQPIPVDQLLLTTEYTFLAILVSAAYFVTFWSGGRRATPGQRIFDIQVGNAFDGQPLTVEQAVRRWLGYGEFLRLFAFTPSLALLSGGLSLVWSIALMISTNTSPTKQGLHDRFANTAVVRPAPASTNLAYGCLLVPAVLAFLAVVALGVLGAQLGQIVSR